MRLATRLVHHPGGTCEHTGAVNPPIYEVSTFRQDGVDVNKGYDYSRTKNPTRTVLEDYIADLEGGTAGFAFSSGMAAISASLMLLRAGDHLIATEGLYGGTYRILTRIFSGLGISCSFVDTSDLAAVAAAFTGATRAVFLETPSNPLMRISDLAAISNLAHERGAIVMVDNTFMSPWLQRPLELGADIAIHSATKFLSGHSDVIVGLAAVKDTTLAGRLGMIQNAAGAIPSPFDCWVLMRGMKTLGLRLSRAQASAGAIAAWLEGRPEVAEVYFPGLPAAAGHALHRRQAEGPGAIISFRAREGEGVSAEAWANGVALWTLGVSLGAVESLIALPARMTHGSYPREERERLGITPDLLRLSVGIEDPADLIEDLEEALGKARR